MKDFKNKITKIAEKLDWGIDINNNEFEFSKYSPAGQDFNFCVNGDDLEEVIKSINEYCDNFDCSEETYLWLDNSGHGANGAPYDMKDLYEDMEACLDMVKELKQELETLLQK